MAKKKAAKRRGKKLTIRRVRKRAAKKRAVKKYTKRWVKSAAVELSEETVRQIRLGRPIVTKLIIVDKPQAKSKDPGTDSTGKRKIKN
jgi:hypothetical protein